jgi:hypothetical protein
MNPFNELRKRIEQARQMEEEAVEFLGKQEVNGQMAIGYRVQEPSGHVTIWADAETLLPLRMEYSMTEMMGVESHCIISDIAFDVELDKSLFSLKVPEGYTVENKKMVMSDPTENSLLRAFRLWTDATEGRFPSALNQKVIMVEFNTGEIKNKWRMFEKVAYGFMFPHQLPESSDWHYVGKDTTFGDAQTPIFWYRPEGSETYRVIYADLSVKDVAPEDVPE